MLVLTSRQEELIRYIQSLDKTARHVLTITCRGDEPWEIKEHIVENKVLIIPKELRHN
jgi:hypothetical protein